MISPSEAKERLVQEMLRLSSIAAARGYPAFLFGPANSTPINSTPYVSTLDHLRADAFGDESHSLVQALRDCLDDLSRTGATARVVLIGGSALDPERVPNDLDCVVFYEGSPSSPDHPIGAWLQRTRDARLDVRLVPLDGDPILTLKSALFFGALYSQRYGEHDHTKGLLLVDCRTNAAA